MSNFVKPQGINFSSPQLTAKDLSIALCRIVSFIQNQELYDVDLKKYEDWWEHDGMHFYKRTIDFHDLFRCIDSSRALLEAMPGENNVFVGIAPQSNNWYLRFYLEWDEEGHNLIGRFDITLPSNLAEHFRKALFTSNLLLVEEDATVFYQHLLS